MTITTDKPRKTARSSKPRRDVGQTNLPTNERGELDMIAVLLEALTVPGRLSQCYNRFHRYSFLNIVLVYMQTGKLEPMGTFKKWQSLGRNVISGPGSALFVNHPRFVPVRDGAGNPVKDEKGRAKQKFVGSVPRPTVFQLFQTDGPELSLPTMPAWDREQAMEALDITPQKFSHSDGNTQGYSAGREFAINPVAEQPFKTMIHEWAHILLGHTEDSEEYHNHRGVKEFQAEAVALLVCTELDVDGYDPATSRGYIQNWLRGDSSEYVDTDGNLLVDNKAVRQVFSVADAIMTAGRIKHYDKLAETTTRQ